MSDFEVFDTFDDKMHCTGTATRAEVHRMGLWHETFHCWIVGRAPDGERSLLFQLRSADKDTFPNLLDISCAGHLLQGEGPQGGLRELKEELGLTVSFSDLYPCGIYPNEYVEPGVLIDREFSHVFLYSCNKRAQDYVFQKSEISGLYDMKVLDFKRLINSESHRVMVQGVRLQGDVIQESIQEVELTHLVPHPKKYYDLILQEMDKMLNDDND